MDDEYEDQALAAPEETGIYTLKLYVTGKTGKCQTALVNLRMICRVYLSGRCRIEVVDLLESPALARANQIVAIPTLVRELPASEWRVVGDLSNTQRVLTGLDLRPAGQAGAK